MSSNDPERITELLKTAKTIAVIGLTNSPFRPSYGVTQYMRSQGYRIIPVNPNITEWMGEKAYPSLLDVPEKVDIVDVFRRAEDTPSVADDAVKVGAKVLWLQTGVVSEEAAARAEAGGLTVVMDACIGSTHAILQVPKKTS